MTSHPSPISLIGLSTAVPEHGVGEERGARFLAKVLEASLPDPERERSLVLLRKIVRGSGIERRFSVLADFLQDDPEQFRFFPPNWQLEPFPTTAQRMKVFEASSVPLAERAARGALEDADIAPSEVTHLVITTCTGFFAPGPDILLSRRLGLPSIVERSIVGFMGCYAGFTGMRTAAQILGSDPDAVVLLVSIELCTLHFQKRAEPDFLVANCLFGDGCAAVVYASDGRRGTGLGRLITTHSAVAGESLDQMSWKVGDTGFEMRLSIEIPDTLKAGISVFAGALLDKAGIRRDEVRGWAIHPGGRRIVEGIREALELSEDDVQASLGVLRDFGNMSSPTIFFVLEELLRGDNSPGPIVALGFGPGLTLEGAVFSRGA